MQVIFYIAAIIAILATLAVITRKNPVHALLYLIVSLLSVAVVFYTLGAPYLAALEVMIYAGAIMILFVFVIMMLNMGKETAKKSSWFRFKYWIGPAILSLILLGELVYVFSAMPSTGTKLTVISAREVGQSLFGPYVLGVELVGMLLLGGTVGAYHIGYKKPKEYHRFLQKDQANHKKD